MREGGREGGRDRGIWPGVHILLYLHGTVTCYLRYLRLNKLHKLCSEELWKAPILVSLKDVLRDTSFQQLKLKGGESGGGGTALWNENVTYMYCAIPTSLT